MLQFGHGCDAVESYPLRAREQRGTTTALAKSQAARLVRSQFKRSSSRWLAAQFPARAVTTRTSFVSMWARSASRTCAVVKFVRTSQTDSTQWHQAPSALMALNNSE